VTPLQCYEAEVRAIVEWAVYLAEGLDTYRRTSRQGNGPVPALWSPATHIGETP